MTRSLASFNSLESCLFRIFCQPLTGTATPLAPPDSSQSRLLRARDFNEALFGGCSAWSGRALQPECDELGAPDLRVCFPKKRISRFSLETLSRGYNGEFAVIKKFNYDILKHLSHSFVHSAFSVESFCPDSERPVIGTLGI
ncbi:hypothetical protein CEXT_183381 [Caerostris extrusa]|uniref:Uncharacterized protein n=1 Tax=Caerostris extrusa TaxID=172846 RepID=A0AAV4VEQ9_CAEEX|nr:hypothetical protein CEXT_183381 [Caerostris extrusa]